MEVNMMNDLIDRQKIKARFEPWLKVKDYSEGELNMLKAVLYEITIMPSALQWIPASEQLPDESAFVLGKFQYLSDTDAYSYAVAWHDGKKWQCWDDRIGFNDSIIAWMPLPE